MAVKVNKIHLGYLPRVWQDKIHMNDARFKVLALHRRAGKSVFAINEIIDRALRCEKRNPQYAYIGVTYGAVKRIIWDLAKNYTKDIPGVTTNEQELTIRIPRPAQGDEIKIMLLGAENPGSIRGVFLDGCILDEVAEMQTEIWSAVIRPALSDRLGWAVFCSTPKGYNNFYDLYQHALNNKDWYAFMLRADESGIIPQSELDAALAEMGEDLFEQEYLCSFGAALTGAYYGKQIQKAEDSKRITSVPYDKAIPVEAYFDLGVGDSTAIWFVQIVGKEYHLIDYMENSGEGLDWYVKEMKNKPYIYSELILPHDAAARELGTGKSREETLREYWPGVRTRILERHDLEDGIHAVRMILDHCWFDAEKCARGISALRAYQKKWDEKNKIMSTKPLHDWASHGADAFRYFALGNKGLVSRKSVRDLPSSADSTYDIFNFSGGN
jgi:phage terminase large subunit